MFTSSFERMGHIALPKFSGLRIMMMPLILGDLSSIPPLLSQWKDALASLFKMRDYDGEVGYLTIDEKHITPGDSHRRPGLHVDGVYRGSGGGWGGSAPWASKANGMLLISTPIGCRAWNQDFDGHPDEEGGCDHLANQCRPDAAQVLEPEVAYWASGLCVHESMLQTKPVDRQLARLSLPSTAPWFEGYTENPLGVKPTGPTLPRRKFMEA